ncbi:glucokinase regulatory protein [Anaeramoeba flamelloides]|uniref:Glucokinase regulatory protein n=1 Tax=Anaeramoeba flamelloides TaxID=1746091 RepID=A0ABQ8XQ43_9EUKA|nr:glucokinase regulatory protein [Anaeramoeba flamelloides]
MTTVPRITELPNTLTQEIDTYNCLEITRSLRATDSQIFNGYLNYESLYDKRIIDTLGSLVDEVSSILSSNNEGLVVLSGCGTSGRLAYFVSRNFNCMISKLRKRNKKQKQKEEKQEEEEEEEEKDKDFFKYLISGGDSALLKSREGQEDNPQLGVKDLKEITKNAKKVLYIGITCGMSAPYVAGQLLYCSKNENTTPVLMGFNPVSMSRNTKIEGWDYSFKEALSQVQQNCQNLHILNPICGPEPVTGSTRMKSGSITKILLDTLFTAAICKAYNLTPSLNVNHNLMPKMNDLEGNSNKEICLKILLQFESVFRSTYLQSNDLHKVIHLAELALQKDPKNGEKGHVYYIGESNAGIIGLIDASECPPTFGASPESIRCFMPFGWKRMNNQEGDMEQIYPNNPFMKNSLQEFKKSFLPILQSNDLLIFLGTNDQFQKGEIAEFLTHVQKYRIENQLEFKIAGILCYSSTKFPKLIENEQFKWGDDLLLKFAFPSLDMIDNYKTLSYSDFSFKLIVNAITTGAHIRIGTVFRNRMINLKVSNNKLFFRAINIIQQLSNVSFENAKIALLRAIYNLENKKQLEEKQLFDTPVSNHLKVAIQKEKVVPTAIVLSIRPKMPVGQAIELLENERIIRNAIEKLLK